jgi:TolB-like protein/Flp pilus assembly protein TadD
MTRDSLSWRAWQCYSPRSPRSPQSPDFRCHRPRGRIARGAVSGHRCRTESPTNRGPPIATSFIAELRRRNVLRVAAAYAAVAWLLIQVAQTIFSAFGLGETALRIVIVVLAVGVLPVLVFAWAFEWTPEGLKRESEVDRNRPAASYAGKTLDRAIMVVLALAVGYFAVDKFALSPRREVALEQQRAAELEAARKQGASEALLDSYGDRSIAVLPFVDLSPNKDQEYFSDGIAEELLNLLAKISNLRVISRSSAFSFKGQSLPITEIARRLNVAHVLEGSVRKAGNDVRITVQLIDARSDAHLWSETYDRPLGNIFAVQDEIAAAVVRQLKIELLDAAVPKAKVGDPTTFALSLQARQLARQRTPEGFERSIALYRQVLAIDPNDAVAWNGLARNYINQAGDGLRPIEEGFRLGREAVEKALASDPNYAPAHAVLGWIAMFHDDDLANAALHIQHALALEPSNTDTIGNAAALAMSLARLDTSIALNEYANARDPVNPTGFQNLGVAYSNAGRQDEAIASYRTALSLSPELAGAQSQVGVALLLKRDAAGALKAMQAESNEGWRLIGLPMAWHAVGDRSKSDAALAEVIEKFGEHAAYNIAYVLAFRDDAGRAFEWLERAVVFRDPGLTEISVNPLFANLHDDPRWLPFLRGIGKAPEQLAAIEFDVRPPQ